MFKTLSLTILCCINLSLQAENVVLRITPNQGSSKTLSILIPSNFMQLSKVITTEQTLYEFIPEGENAYMWNEIITVMKAPHNGRSLDDFVQDLGKRYEENKEKWVYSIREENGMQVGYLIARLPVQLPHPTKAGETMAMLGKPDKAELLTMKIIRGKDQFAIVQFSARYATDATSADKDSVKLKCLGFLKSCKIP